MNKIGIDNNSLVYIYQAAPQFGGKYVNLLGTLSRDNTLLIPKIVYRELSIIFKTDKALNDFLGDTGIIIGEIAPVS